MKKFVLNPIAVLLWIWLAVVFGIGIALAYFFAILIHEAGHYFAAKKLGFKLCKFAISPYGFSLSYYQQNMLREEELKIALAGPLANFVSAFLTISLWWIFPDVFSFTYDFVVQSMLLGLFNLLPCFPLDGGRIFICLSSKIIQSKTAQKITIIINLILGVFFLLMFFVSVFINFNPTLMLFGFFLIVGILDLQFNSKYEKISIFCKKTKDFSKINLICVSQEVCLKELIKRIENAKNTAFLLVLENGKSLILSEKLVLNMSLQFPNDTKLKEIIKS